MRRASRSPRFLIDPCRRAVFSDPGELDATTPADCAALRIDVAFDVDKRLGALDFNTFGIQPHGPSARCLRFVVTVARYVSTTTQDSLPRERASAPRGRDLHP